MATPDNGTRPTDGLSSKALHAEALKRITPEEWQSVAGDAAAIQSLIERYIAKIKAEGRAGGSTKDGSTGGRASAAPAVRRPAAEPSDAALDETAADVDASDESGAGAEAGDVDLNRIYDRPEVAAAADAASLARFDPEAGRTSVAVKVKAVTQAVRNTVTTPFGKLIVTLPIVLLGLSLSIAAVTMQDTPFIVAAALVMPVSVGLAYWRYQIWLGHKRYMYRLLESLGEDVSDFDPHRIYRKAGSRSVKRRR